jgi:hypothetical protein
MTPVVSVPVLSSSTVSSCRLLSSASGPRMRMPSCAPRPVPTISAVGVARPSAQGQAMMSTATAAVNAAPRPLPGADPEAQRRDGEADHHGHEDAGDAVGQPLHLRLAVLRVLHQPGHLGELGVAADPGGPDDEPPAGVDGRPGDGGADADLDRTDSPVSIEASTALLPRDDAVGRDLLPGRTTNRSPTASWSVGMRTSPRREHGDVLGTELGSARRAPGARLDRASR